MEEANRVDRRDRKIMHRMREAKPGDTGEIIELLRQIGNPPTHVHSEKTEKFSANDLLDVIRGCETVVLEDGGKVSGFISFREISRYSGEGEEPERNIMIMAVAVDEVQRGHGFGMALMKFVHEIAETRNHRSIYLNVAADNKAAICLYRKLGFIVASTLMFKSVVSEKNAVDSF